MRRLFIIRKDLNMKSGKLGAMLAHCAEAYWTNLIKKCAEEELTMAEYDPEFKEVVLKIPFSIWKEYVNGIFTKTICECKNLNALKKVESVIKEVNGGLPIDCQLKCGIDYGYINDKCLTDLTPENPDGTTTVGIWFRPLPDEIAHKLSKKYQLYREKSKTRVYSVSCHREWIEGEDDYTLANYTSEQGARKHLEHLFKELSESKEYSNVNWNSYGGFTCKYNLFKYDNIETYDIREDVIEIKEKFEEVEQP